MNVAGLTLAVVLLFHGSPEEPGFGSVELRGLPTELLEQLEQLDLDRRHWSRHLAVYRADSLEQAEGLPPVLGSYEVNGSSIFFRPRFAFAAGLTYVARLDGQPWGVEDRTLRFVMPEPPDQEPPTRVLAVHPSAAELPDNLLRFYVHFSAPMRAHQVHRHVRLVRDDGAEVAEPFVVIPDGLWDPGQRRLTLLLHPGRIKRGVGPNRALGPPLVAGSTYHLVIDAAFPDSAGRALAGTHMHSFRVVAADRSSPRPDRWQVVPPSAQDEPLTLHFPEPLDHGLLQRMIQVLDATDRPVSARVDIGSAERSWRLYPDEGWSPGRYRILVDPALEDLAGNRIDRLFEQHDQSAHSDAVDPFVVGSFELP